MYMCVLNKINDIKALPFSAFENTNKICKQRLSVQNYEMNVMYYYFNQ